VTTHSVPQTFSRRSFLAGAAAVPLAALAAKLPASAEPRMDTEFAEKLRQLSPEPLSALLEFVTAVNERSDGERTRLLRLALEQGDGTAGTLRAMAADVRARRGAFA
jgi:hypothetical protein